MNLEPFIYPRSYALDALILIESIQQRLNDFFLRCKGDGGKSVRNSCVPSCIEELDTVLSVCEELLNAYSYPYEITDIEEDAEATNNNVFKPCLDQPVLHTPWESPRKSLLASGLQARFQKKSGYQSKHSRKLQIEDFTAATHSASLWTVPSSTAFVNQAQGSQQQLDTLLFHLVIALQLCQVRVEEACSIFTSSHTQKQYLHRTNKFRALAIGGFFFAGTVCLVEARNSDNDNFNLFQFSYTKESSKTGTLMKFLTSSGKALTFAFSTYQMRRWWRNLCVNARITDTIETLTFWQQKWILCQCCSAATRMRHTNNTAKSQQDMTDDGAAMALQNTSKADYQIEVIQATTKKLLECSSLQSPTKTFWHSQGGLRFLLLKRAMDLVYASIGTAIQVTEGSEKNDKSSSLLWVPVAAAAASYYVLTGADATSVKAQEAISSPLSSDIICRSWKLVGLPAIKRVSLEVSKLLKGAAIADRVTLAGVPCFVISSNPCDSLSAALKRSLRRPRSQLETIIETGEDLDSTSDEEDYITVPKEQKTDLNYPTKDVILHLTGGGFFAHTIASDLPFLIDWSAATDTVIICPEYSLLPEHCFPMAINQIRDIYRLLVRGDASPLLGFRARKVVITGESVGGNLGAALVVKLFQDAKGQISAIQLPDAMLLCCPVLNLARSVSQSRAICCKGEDPVLPNGLISTISEAYLPINLGLSKEDPVASPYFASDEILSCFPPNLIFASSTDPLLDDSVVYHTRLTRLGVESELRAVHNMPHAYWGLGTAGFPEAKQVQNECKLWLHDQFSR